MLLAMFFEPPTGSENGDALLASLKDTGSALRLPGGPPILRRSVAPASWKNRSRQVRVKMTKRFSLSGSSLSLKGAGRGLEIG